MNFSASISTANLQAANAELELQGFGPGNFSVPTYAGPSPSVAILHCWNDPVFEAAVAAIPGVTIQQGLATPADTVVNLCTTIGVEWGGGAPLLTGNVTPGLYRDTAGVLWWVIQAYDTTTFPDPTIIPALIRQAKIPGERLPWVQPIDQYDAYKLVNAFTGESDLCTHEGQDWYVSDADGAGNNVFEPGVYGWTSTSTPTVQPWVQGGGTGTAGSYNLNDEVTHDNPNDGGAIWLYRSKIDANTTEPGRDGTFDRWWQPVNAV
jgi:hypothetical protein